MPYTLSSSNLPSYIKNKPDHIKMQWISIFNAIYKDKGEETAFMVANGWLKRHLKKKATMIKRSIVRFDVDRTSPEFIKRDNSGEDYISFVLSDTQPHYDGKIFTESLLKKWVDSINSGQTITGDFDHEYYDRLQQSGISDEQVRVELKQKKGIAKSIKAFYENGKMWIKALIDKRYKKLVEKASNGVSAEALCTFDGNEAVDGELLGFTFNLATQPAIQGAGVMV